MARRRFGKRRSRRMSKKAVRKMIRAEIARNTELKYHDLYQSGAAGDDVSSSGVLYNLTNIAQGNTDITRNGDKLLPKSIVMRWEFRLGDVFNCVRCIIFRWKQNTISISPTAGYILSPSAVGTENAPLGLYNWDTRNNFEILRDFKVQLWDEHQTKNGKVFINLKKSRKKVAFDNGTVNGTNQIWMLLISDSGASTHPVALFQNRIAYTDS